MGIIENFWIFLRWGPFFAKIAQNHDFGRLFGRPPHFPTGLGPPPQKSAGPFGGSQAPQTPPKTSLVGWGLPSNLGWVSCSRYGHYKDCPRTEVATIERFLYYSYNVPRQYRIDFWPSHIFYTLIVGEFQESNPFQPMLRIFNERLSQQLTARRFGSVLE